jgi:hypothetical protein
VGFSTAGANGPQVRSVILRAVNAVEHQLVFYTDARSQKMAEIAHDPRIALLFWNARNNTQLRVCGKASPESSELIVNSCWDRIPDYARKDYATLSAPGQVLGGSDLRHDFEIARRNFVVLNVNVQSMELLVLKREGHVRVGFEKREGGNWQETGLVP